MYAELRSERSATRVVQTLGLYADVCPKRAIPGPNSPDLPDSGSTLAEMGFEFGPTMPRFGTCSTLIGQFDPESTKFGPGSTEMGPTSPNSPGIDPIWLEVRLVVKKCQGQVWSKIVDSGPN